MVRYSDEVKSYTITIRISEKMKNEIEKFNPSKSEFIREAIKEKLERESKKYLEKLKEERKKLIERLKEINEVIKQHKIREQQERKAQIEREKEIIVSAITNYFGYLNRERIEYKLRTQGKERFKQKLEREFERIAKEMKKDVNEVRKIVLDAFPELKELEL